MESPYNGSIRILAQTVSKEAYGPINKKKLEE